MKFAKLARNQSKCGTNPSNLSSKPKSTSRKLTLSNRVLIQASKVPLIIKSRKRKDGDVLLSPRLSSRDCVTKLKHSKKSRKSKRHAHSAHRSALKARVVGLSQLGGRGTLSTTETGTPVVELMSSAQSLVIRAVPHFSPGLAILASRCQSKRDSYMRQTSSVRNANV